MLGAVRAPKRLSSGIPPYRRACYVQVADLSGEVPWGTDRAVFQSIGGIRGLSAIDGPVRGKQSLIFMRQPGPRSSMGCVLRLDPQAGGSYALVREACLAEHVRKYLDGAPVYRVRLLNAVRF